MEQLRSTQARDWREGRRLRTWELHQQGWKQHEIATALGVTQGAAASGCAGLERAVALKHSVAEKHRELPHDSPQSNGRVCLSFWLGARRLMALGERCGRVREWPR